jgi:serine/threonine-protein phosphatase PGAM5
MSRYERTVYLVRHGQLDMQAFAKDHFTAGLTAVGRDQARLTARRLRSVGASSIHCSTLGRARETAAIVAEAIPNLVVRPSRLLWELPNLGPEHDRTWRPVFKSRLRRGERAFVKFVRPARHQGCVDILVSHGNLIRYFVCRILGIAPESWSSLGTSHCGITQVSVAPDLVRIVCYNETRHLPDRLRT